MELIVKKSISSKCEVRINENKSIIHRRLIIGAIAIGKSGMYRCLFPRVYKKYKEFS